MMILRKFMVKGNRKWEAFLVAPVFSLEEEVKA